MKLLSFLHVLGRGIEGCGVSRYCLELDKWLTTQGHDSDIVALKDKWTLGKMLMKTEDAPIHVLDPAALSSLDVSNYDCVIIHSFPPSRGPKGSTGATRVIDTSSGDAIQKLIAQANAHGCRTTAIVLDHHPMSWGRNMDFWQNLQDVDLVLAHSDHGRLLRYMQKNGVDTPLRQLALAMGFDDCELNWIPTADQHRRVSYVGRYANFKDPGRMFKIRAQIPAKERVIVTMAGVARVIESAWIRKEPTYIEGEQSLGKKLTELESTNEAHAGVIVYREHPRPWGLEYLRHTAIACDFYHMAAEDYGADTEYAILEAVAMGAVIALDPHYVENCSQFTGHGMWASGTWLTISKDPIRKEINDVLDLLNDSKYRHGLRLTQLKFMRKNHSPDVVFPALLESLELQ